jgi:tetratricopeptide (TPR) repeat protein
MFSRENNVQLMARIWMAVNAKHFDEGFLLLSQTSPQYRNDSWFLAQARCWLGIKNHGETLKSLSMIKGSTKKTALLCWAYCYKEMGQYGKALKIFEQIPDEEKDKSILISLTHCYEKMGQYDEALKIYDNLLSRSKEKQTLINLARCYQAMGQHDKSIMTLRQITNWEIDKEALLGFVSCYRDIGKYDEAVKSYNHILSMYNDTRTGGGKQILISLIRCYEEMGQYEKALNLYYFLLNGNKDKHTLISIAHCYEKMGEHDGALRAFYCVPNWGSDTEVLLALACCYQEMGQYEEALKHYDFLLNIEKDKRTLISLASCYESMGQHTKAIRIFHQIPCWEKDKEVLLNLARCYQQMAQYNHSLKTFYQIPNWEKDNEALLGLAHCYQEMGWNERTLHAYQMAIKQFPYDYTICYQWCHYLIEQSYPDAKNILEKCIKQFPDRISFYLLKATYESQQKKASVALDTLNRTVQRFPYNVDTYLALIRHHLFSRQMNAAKKCQQDCFERFKFNHQLFRQIQKLLNAEAIIQYWGEDYAMDEKEIKVGLSLLVPAAFALVAGLSGEYYLVGDAVHALLNNEPPSPPQNIDLVVTSDINELQVKGFFPCSSNAHLYTTKINDFLVNCYVILAPHTLSRDFTITALYCNSEGYVLDPTGMGIDDFNKKTLRTIGHPLLRFQEDPIRILRAIKYIVSGYTPTPDVKDALKNWRPFLDYDCAPMRAIIRKHFASTNKIEYIKQLQHYGLLQKIFNIIPDDILEVTVRKLEESVKTYPARSSYSARQNDIVCRWPSLYLFRSYGDYDMSKLQTSSPGALGLTFVKNIH